MSIQASLYSKGSPGIENCREIQLKPHPGSLEWGFVRVLALEDLSFSTGDLH